MKPAAMLVGAFEIEDFVGPAVANPVNAREIREVFRIAQREGMSRAGIEPDIENVVDLFVFFRFVFGRQESRGGARREPGVGTLLFESLRDALVDLVVDKNLLCFPIDEDRDRHAPSALARDNPIRPIGDHAGDAVFPRGRIPFRQGDLVERDLAQGPGAVDRLIERDKPLRRIAEDDRLFGAPGMRILVF